MAIDMIDDKILLTMQRKNPSIADLTEVTGLAASSIHARLVKLQDNGLITPPSRKGNARDRVLTPFGKKYLIRNGLVQGSLFENESGPT